MGEEAQKRELAERLDGAFPGPILGALAECRGQVRRLGPRRRHAREERRRGAPVQHVRPRRSERRRSSPTYRKVHLFDVSLADGTSLPRERGDQRRAPSPSPPRSSASRFGLSVCYDLRFPELYRRLVDQGARVVTVPARLHAHDRQGPLARRFCGRAPSRTRSSCSRRRSTASTRAAARRTASRSSSTPGARSIAQCSEGEGYATANLDFAYQDRVRTSRPVPLASPVVMRVPLVDLAAQEAAVADAVLGVDRRGRARRAVRARRRGSRHFERWLAEECGAKHAVGVASGTDALELGLRALGIGAGDAVVTPAFSFIAAAEAIAVDRRAPRLLRRRRGDAQREREDRRGRRSTARATPACASAPSCPCTSSGCARLRRALVGARGARGARPRRRRGPGPRRARRVGAVRRQARATPAASASSRRRTSARGATAGALVTSRDDVAARVRRLRAHGATSPYVHAELGRNSRLDAAAGRRPPREDRRTCPPWQTAARPGLAFRYRAELDGLPLVLPVDPAAARGARVARVRRPDRAPRRPRRLAARSTASRRASYYPVPLHRQPCFASLDEPAAPGRRGGLPHGPRAPRLPVAPTPSSSASSSRSTFGSRSDVLPQLRLEVLARHVGPRALRLELEVLAASAAGPGRARRPAPTPSRG